MESSPKKQQIKAQKQTEQELMNETNISMDKKSELTELTEGHESEENAPSISDTTEIINKLYITLGAISTKYGSEIKAKEPISML